MIFVSYVATFVNRQEHLYGNGFFQRDSISSREDIRDLESEMAEALHADSIVIMNWKVL